MILKKQNKVLAIILCRIGSKRLKNKLFLRINDQFILKIFLERLKKSKQIDKIVFATSTKFKDNRIEKFAIDNGYKCFRGSETNVLQRFHGAINKFGKKCDIVVRANADCPLFMPTILDRDIKKFIKSKNDIYSPFYKNIMPFGFSFVIFKKNIVNKIYKRAKLLRHKEHIENYCFENNDQFKILLSNKNEHYKLKKLAVTLDTKKDFLRIKNIYNIIKDIKINKQPSLTINLFKKKLFF